MIRFNNPLSRLLAAIGLSIILLVIFITSFLFLPNNTLAQVNHPNWAEANLSQKNPRLVSPLSRQLNLIDSPTGNGRLTEFQPNTLLHKNPAPPNISTDKISFGVDSSDDHPLSSQTTDIPETGQANDLNGMIGTLAYTVIISENFESGNFLHPSWYIEDLSTDGFSRTWGVTTLQNSTPGGSRSVWPAAGGADAITPTLGYTKNLHSRMTIGPLNFSNVEDALVSFVVIEAQNGKQALEIVQEERLDLIIADIRMPEMDGCALLTNLRAKFPGLPVLAISGRVDPEELENFDFDGFIEKPIGVNELQERVEVALANVN